MESKMTPEQIKAARHTLGLTQTAFGKLLHAALSTVQHWEDGSKNMQGATAELLGIKLKEHELSKMMVTVYGDEANKCFGPIYKINKTC
jgi:DNA-binding transcriptional regulator YiaG